MCFLHCFLLNFSWMLPKEIQGLFLSLLASFSKTQVFQNPPLIVRTFAVKFAWEFIHVILLWFLSDYFYLLSLCVEGHTVTENYLWEPKGTNIMQSAVKGQNKQCWNILFSFVCSSNNVSALPLYTSHFSNLIRMYS